MRTNSPFARATFRVEDWTCPHLGCGAYNLSRNAVCKMCAFPRIPRPPPEATIALTPSQAPSSRFQNLPPVPRLLFDFQSLSLDTNSGSGYSSFAYANKPMSSPLEHISPRIEPLVPPVHRAAASLPHFQPSGPPPQNSFPPQNHAMSSPCQRSQSPFLGAAQQHVLTPSGRAFSHGGRVRNVSSDPLAPSIMFWPDNEPLPEPGQVRPSTVVGVVHPPILNTGNRGPIEHQPGDWVCKKCSYLNWRRRKVCQTCYPYAEGNSDSVSTTVQASRIAILRQLCVSQVDPARAYTPATPPSPRHPGELHRLQMSKNDRHGSLSVDGGALGLALGDSMPIYQTLPDLEVHSPMSYSHASWVPAGVLRDDRRPLALPSPLRPVLRSSNESEESQHSDPDLRTSDQHVIFSTLKAEAPAPATALLPSFLNEVVQSPSLSPASSALSEIDLEHSDYQTSPATSCASFGGYAYHSPKVMAAGVPVVRAPPRTSSRWRADTVDGLMLGPIGSGRKSS